MMTAQSPFSGKRVFESRLIPVATPMAIMLVALPFVDSQGPSSDLAMTVSRVAGLAACALVVLFLLLVVTRPKGWEPKKTVESAETITLWLMACVVVAYVF